MERMLRKKGDTYGIDRELTGKLAIESNAKLQDKVEELEEENKKLKENIETLEDELTAIKELYMNLLKHKN